MHRLPYMQRHLQKHLDKPSRCRIYVLQQRGNKARHRLSETMGGPGKIQRRLGDEKRQASTEIRRQSKASPQLFLQPDISRQLMTIMSHGTMTMKH